jgi:ankyrin repeat protein
MNLRNLLNSSNSSSFDLAMQQRLVQFPVVDPLPVMEPRMVQNRASLVHQEEQEEESTSMDIDFATDQQATDAESGDAATEEVRGSGDSKRGRESEGSPAEGERPEKRIRLAPRPKTASQAAPISSEAFNEAAISGNLETVRRAIALGSVDINSVDEDDYTALMHAAEVGNADIVAELLKADVDINAVNEEGMTALALAAVNGHADVVANLFNAGALIDTADIIGDTALMFAAEKGFNQIVRLLLSTCVVVNAVNDEGMTALILATRAGKLETMRLLLEKGAQVNLCGAGVDNATVTAISANNIPALELLLGYGGDPGNLQPAHTGLVADMLRYRELFKPTGAANAQTLASQTDLITPVLSDMVSVCEAGELPALLVQMALCSPIATYLEGQLVDVATLWKALAAGTGQPVSEQQKLMSMAGILMDLALSVMTFPNGASPYEGKGLRAEHEAKLTAILREQVAQLVALGEQAEETLADAVGSLMEQCVQYTRQQETELVIDEAGLVAHLTGRLGLYGPLAVQMAAAWSRAVQQQKAMILAATQAQPQTSAINFATFDGNDWDLFLNEPVRPPALQVVFGSQAEESAARQVLLAAFGAALSQIDQLEGKSALYKSGSLQGKQAELYTYLLFRQLHLQGEYVRGIAAMSQLPQ